MIDLLEELRRDAPGIPDRHDPRAAALQQAMSPDRVLAALGEAAPSTAVAPAVPGAAAAPIDDRGDGLEPADKPPAAGAGD